MIVGRTRVRTYSMCRCMRNINETASLFEGHSDSRKGKEEKPCDVVSFAGTLLVS